MNKPPLVINRPRKILVATPLYPPDIGGPATYAKLLKEKLPLYTRNKVRVIIANFGEVGRWPKILSHSIYFFKVLYRGRYCDAIYALDPVSVGLPACLAAKLLRQRFLLKIVGDYAWEQGTIRFGVKNRLDDFSCRTNGYRWPVLWLKRVQTWVSRQAEMVVVPSQYLKQIIINWGLPSAKIKVIYNAFNTPEMDLNKKALREKLEVQGKVVTTVGRLVPWKGFVALIQLWPRLLALWPNLKLLIIGEGPERAKLEVLVEELKLGENVLLTGKMNQPDLFRYLKLADIFVLNTGYEGFSHLLLEALALGTPMVTTRVGGNAEIIADGKNGLLVEPDDEEELVSSLKRLLSDHNLADKLSRGGLKTVANFNEERMINELLPILIK